MILIQKIQFFFPQNCIHIYGIEQEQEETIQERTMVSKQLRPSSSRAYLGGLEAKSEAFSSFLSEEEDAVWPPPPEEETALRLER